MPLSDFTCKDAKAKDKPYRLVDGEGLYLLVQESGSKLGQLRCRHLEKEKILSFGKYPLVSLLGAIASRARDPLLVAVAEEHLADASHLLNAHGGTKEVELSDAATEAPKSPFWNEVKHLPADEIEALPLHQPARKAS